MGFKLQPTIDNKQSKDFDIEAFLKKDIDFLGNTFSNKKKENFYVELSVLLKAGLDLKDALELIVADQKKERHKNIVKGVIEDLILGKNFSIAIRNQKVFSEYEFYSLEIGERTGTLQKVCEELGVFFTRKNTQKRAIINALSYPSIVMITAFLALGFMLNFVVPMFADIFRQNKIELPWVTQQIITLSKAFQKNYFMMFIGILFFVIFIRMVIHKPWYRKLSSLILLKIPFVGEFIRKVKLAQFTQAISLLTSAKIPLLQGIQLTKKMINFYPLQQALTKVEADILKGKSLHQSIVNLPIFDKKMSALIRIAEQTNQTETVFNRLTYQYNQEIDSQSKLISSAIEPFIILVLGGIVGVILIAMYLPMFQLSTVIN